MGSMLEKIDVVRGSNPDTSRDLGFEVADVVEWLDNEASLSDAQKAEVEQTLTRKYGSALNVDELEEARSTYRTTNRQVNGLLKDIYETPRGRFMRDVGIFKKGVRGVVDTFRDELRPSKPPVPVLYTLDTKLAADPGYQLPEMTTDAIQDGDLMERVNPDKSKGKGTLLWEWVTQVGVGNEHEDERARDEIIRVNNELKRQYAEACQNWEGKLAEPIRGLRSQLSNLLAQFKHMAFRLASEAIPDRREKLAGLLNLIQRDITEAVESIPEDLRTDAEVNRLVLELTHRPQVDIPTTCGQLTRGAMVLCNSRVQLRNRSYPTGELHVAVDTAGDATQNHERVQTLNLFAHPVPGSGNGSSVSTSESDGEVNGTVALNHKPEPRHEGPLSHLQRSARIPAGAPNCEGNKPCFLFLGAHQILTDETGGHYLYGSGFAGLQLDGVKHYVDSNREALVAQYDLSEVRSSAHNFFSNLLDFVGEYSEAGQALIGMYQTKLPPKARARLRRIYGISSISYNAQEGGLYIAASTHGSNQRNGRAVLYHLRNPHEVLGGASPEFGDSVYVDLGGYDVHLIEWIPRLKQYAVVSSPTPDGVHNLYLWDGESNEPVYLQELDRIANGGVVDVSEDPDCPSALRVSYSYTVDKKDITQIHRVFVAKPGLTQDAFDGLLSECEVLVKSIRSEGETCADLESLFVENRQENGFPGEDLESETLFMKFYGLVNEWPALKESLTDSRRGRRVVQGFEKRIAHIVETMRDILKPLQESNDSKVTQWRELLAGSSSKGEKLAESSRKKTAGN
jgi:hypothetical protein